jgi:hypothetical protein
MSPVSTSTPKGNTTRFQVYAGPAKRSARHHSTKARNGKSIKASALAPATPYLRAASTTTKMRPQRVGLPYSYENSVAYAAKMAVSKPSAMRPTTGTNERRVAKKRATAPAADRAVTIHAAASYPGG